MSRRGARGAVAAAVLGFAAAVSAGAAEPTVSSTLDPPEVTAGGIAHFTIEVRGGMFTRVRFRPDFELDNLEPVGRPAHSDEIRMVNGRTSRIYRVTWPLRAIAPGPARVYSVRIVVGDETLMVPDAETRVVEAPRVGSAPRQDPDGRPPGARPHWPAQPKLFLHAEITPDDPWTGQQVLYTLWLYSQVPVASISLSRAPEAPGCWVEEIPVAGDRLEWQRTTVDGTQMQRAPLLRRALFPLRPGRHRIAPAEVSLLVRDGRSDPFRAFRTPVLPQVLHSAPIDIEARPLPPPPPGFSGAVGQIDISARVEPPELRVGEHATLELALAGSGHLRGVTAPAVADQPGLEVLPPAESGGSAVAGETVGTERSWSYPLVPAEAGLWRLPPVELGYFDPEAGEYRVASSRPLLLRAWAGDAASADGSGLEPHPVRSAALPPAVGPARWRRALPWLFALPWALVLATVVLRHRGARRHPEEWRRFHHALEAARDEDRPRRAATALEAAWRGYLATRWRVPPELPAASWPEHLAAGGTDPVATDALGTLVHDLQDLRQAPQLSAVSALAAELIERSRATARALG